LLSGINKKEKAFTHLFLLKPICFSVVALGSVVVSDTEIGE
jgi:hypothetical protein